MIQYDCPQLKTIYLKTRQKKRHLKRRLLDIHDVPKISQRHILFVMDSVYKQTHSNRSITYKRHSINLFKS